MPKYTSRKQEDFQKTVIPEAYTSGIVKLFLSLLNKNSAEPQILDVGPVCSENIMFLGRHAKRLYICDLFHRLYLSRKGAIPKEGFWQSLDYPEESFDGILLWDLIDRMDGNEMQRLASFCLSVLRPGGLIFLTALSRQTSLTHVNTFVVGDEFQVSFRQQKHLDLSVNYRHNREIVAVFSPLSLAKAQINKNGFREFLLQMVPE